MSDELRDKKRCCAYICGPHLEPCILVKAHDEKDCICLKCCAAEQVRAERMRIADKIDAMRSVDNEWGPLNDLIDELRSEK